MKSIYIHTHTVYTVYMYFLSMGNPRLCSVHVDCVDLFILLFYYFIIKRKKVIKLRHVKEENKNMVITHVEFGLFDINYLVGFTLLVSGNN